MSEKRIIGGKEYDVDPATGAILQHLPTQQLIETTGLTREQRDEYNEIHSANEKLLAKGIDIDVLSKTPEELVKPIEEKPAKPPSKSGESKAKGLKKTTKVLATSGEPTADEATSETPAD